MRRPLAAIALVALIAGCGGPLFEAPAPVREREFAPQGRSTQDRMTIRTGAQTVVVDSAAAIGRAVEQMILSSGGYIEHSNVARNGDVAIRGRVPSLQLDSLMDQVGAMGVEKRRQLTGSDVGDQFSDLLARQNSTMALRDRLQQLLERANTLDEVLKLEKEIARLQTDIDALQAKIDQLQGQATLAVMSVDLEAKQELGPIAAVGRGVGKLIASLFVKS